MSQMSCVLLCTAYELCVADVLGVAHISVRCRCVGVLQMCEQCVQNHT